MRLLAHHRAAKEVGMADADSLVEALEDRAGTLKTLGYRVRFELTDTDEIILLDATGGQASVTRDAGEADTTLRLTTDVLERLIARRLSPMLAFSTGKLKVDGSRGVALKLASLLDED
jgi:putative sterol carrier protein